MNKKQTALLMIDSKVVLIENELVEWIQLESSGFCVYWAMDASPELIRALNLVADGTLTQATFIYNGQSYHAECIPAYASLMEGKRDKDE